MSSFPLPQPARSCQGTAPRPCRRRGFDAPQVSSLRPAKPKRGRADLITPRAGATGAVAFARST